MKISISVRERHLWGDPCGEAANSWLKSTKHSASATAYVLLSQQTRKGWRKIWGVAWKTGSKGLVSVRWEEGIQIHRKLDCSDNSAQRAIHLAQFYNLLNGEK